MGKVLAFIYDDYSETGIQDSFAGYYKDENDAKEVLRGQRHGLNSNLEILDLNTLGFTYYKWVPRYEDKYEYDAFELVERYGSERREKVIKYFLKDPYKPDTEWFPVIQSEWDGSIRDPRWDEGKWSIEPRE